MALFKSFRNEAQQCRLPIHSIICYISGFSTAILSLFSALSCTAAGVQMRVAGFHASHQHAGLWGAQLRGSRLQAAYLSSHLRFAQKRRISAVAQATTITMSLDPFETHTIVEQLVSGDRNPTDKSNFEIDHFSEPAKVVRKELDNIFKPFAVGGRVVFEDNDLFSSERIEQWITFLGEETTNVAEVRRTLSERRIPVDEIVAIATHASSGKGPETIFDSAVREPLEISADRLVLAEDLFTPWLPTGDFRLRNEIEYTMNAYNADWNYRLQKMHVIGPGGGGKSCTHIDTVHQSNQTATVFVGLPVEYEGGSLVVKYLGKTSSYNLSNNDSKCVLYCAFSTDCEYEIQEVTAGWCLMLQYDASKNIRDGLLFGDLSSLVYCWGDYHDKSRPKPDAMSLAEIAPHLENAVLEHMAAHPKGDRVAIVFSHRYSLPDLQECALHGSDSILYQVFSSDKWKRKLQAIVFTWLSEYYMGMSETLRAIPVSMNDFYSEEIGVKVAPQYMGTTRIILLGSSPPGSLVFRRVGCNTYGDDAAFGCSVLYACCVILEQTDPSFARIDNVLPGNVPDSE